MASKEIYVSTDIEADGPIPGPYSMLSFGSAAFNEGGDLISTFQANLETLEGAVGHPDTMKWWSTQEDAWAACRKDLQDPKVAMAAYSDWLLGLPGTPVFVGYPATYDFLFVYWYLIKFTGDSPMGFSGLDVKSYACAMLKKPFKQAGKRGMPGRWFKGTRKHTHEALDDAVGQGQLFMNMRRENLSGS